MYMDEYIYTNSYIADMKGLIAYFSRVWVMRYDVIWDVLIINFDI